MFYIYKLTCLQNGKGYVGATNNPAGRLAGHKYRARHGSKLPIHCAMQKYGIEFFRFDVLYSSLDRQHVFGMMESQFIKEEHTLISENGYNLTTGGEGVNRKSFTLPPRTKEFRERMRQIHLGRPKSEEHKQHLKVAKSTPEAKEKMRLLMLGNQRSVGYHHSDAAKKAISESHKGKIFSEETRKKMSISAKKAKKPMWSESRRARYEATILHRKGDCN
jgi:group I intron endonuclease